MSKGAHIHVVDGKNVPYPDDACPICKPEIIQTKAETQIPQVYRKGSTVVTKISKGSMGTFTYWEKGKCFLVSTKKMMFGTDRKVVRDSKGMPLWNNITYRLSVELAKTFVSELSKLIQDIGGETSVPKRE